eukprot:m.266638 g.266638  ORF g.266638 m.266638 type:complete len:396 (+) comp54703_c0_seq4:730-1917(+)
MVSISLLRLFCFHCFVRLIRVDGEGSFYSLHCLPCSSQSFSFHSLCLLDLGENVINDFESIAALGKLKFLNNLNLKGNKITQLEGYEEQIRKLIPSLHVLDGKRLEEFSQKSETRQSERKAKAEKRKRIAEIIARGKTSKKPPAETSKKDSEDTDAEESSAVPSGKRSKSADDSTVSSESATAKKQSKTALSAQVAASPTKPKITALPSSSSTATTKSGSQITASEVKVSTTAVPPKETITPTPVPAKAVTQAPTATLSVAVKPSAVVPSAPVQPASGGFKSRKQKADLASKEATANDTAIPHEQTETAVVDHSDDRVELLEEPTQESKKAKKQGKRRESKKPILQVTTVDDSQKSTSGLLSIVTVTHKTSRTTPRDEPLPWETTATTTLQRWDD